MYEQCREILIKEHEAVAKAAALQKLVQNAVVRREWTGFEELLSGLNSVSDEINALEREREVLFDKFETEDHETGKITPVSPQKHHISVELAGGDKGRFYTLCSRFTSDQRSEIGDIYRSLKLEALKLRMANDTLLEYLDEIKTTMTGFFEAAFPERSGKIYTQRGKRLSHDMRSMVLNRQM